MPEKWDSSAAVYRPPRRPDAWSVSQRLITVLAWPWGLLWTFVFFDAHRWNSPLMWPAKEVWAWMAYVWIPVLTVFAILRACRYLASGH